jgi:AraC family transcriptional regulator
MVAAFQKVVAMLSSSLAVKSNSSFTGFVSTRRAAGPLAKPGLTLVETGAYGMRMARHLHLAAAPSISVRTRRKAVLAVTRLRSETGLSAPTTPLPAEAAFCVQLHLRPVSPVQVWLRGEMAPTVTAAQEGSVTICPLEKEPALYLGDAFDVVQFYVSRAALDEFADENDGCRAETLAWPAGKPDPGLQNLANCLLPVLNGPQVQSELYLEHLVLAAHAYIARTYGGIQPAPHVTRGGLAPWQMQRATEILRANLDGQVSLAHVARECKLSVSHFVRAFKQTAGEPPYRWLLNERIALAKELLLHSGLPMVEIALKCGFADQACFIRAFRKVLNSTPGEWRRVRLQ